MKNFVGNEGLCPWPPLKPFLKEGFKDPKNFKMKKKKILRRVRGVVSDAFLNSS